MYPKDIYNDIQRAFPDRSWPGSEADRTSIHVSAAEWPVPPGWIEDWMMAQRHRLESVYQLAKGTMAPVTFVARSMR